MLDISALICGGMAADKDRHRGAETEALADRNHLLLRFGSGYVRLHHSGYTCDPLWAERYTLDEAEALCSGSPDMLTIRFPDDAGERCGRAIPLVERT